MPTAYCAVNPLPTAGGVSLACSSSGYVPKVTAANTLGCSQIFDNGANVGIDTTSGFTYSSLSGGRLSVTVPPSSGTVRFEVNGVERSLAEIITSDAKYKENINSIPNP